MARGGVYGLDRFSEYMKGLEDRKSGRKTIDGVTVLDEVHLVPI